MKVDVHYPDTGDPRDVYGCLECGWDVPLVNGQIPALCEECGDPAEEVGDEPTQDAHPHQTQGRG